MRPAPAPPRLLVALVPLALVAFAGVSLGQPAARAPVATTPHFALFSDLDTNLNDALINAGRARQRHEPELFHAGDEAACFDGLPAATRAGWDAAVDYAQKVLSPVGWSDREQFRIRMQLVGFLPEARGPGTPADLDLLEIAGALRAAAKPAYAACRWAAQDAKNRAWIAEMEPRLAADEEQLAPRLAALYRRPWGKLPILVDVVETVDWSGANTAWSDAGQGDVLIANAPGGAAGFETLFHEASHTLMDRGDPIPRALADAARTTGVRLPGDLAHVVLFYTTGEAVRRRFEERGEHGYTPMLYGIFARHAWVEYRAALEKCWRPYVDGERSLDEAAVDLLRALPARDPR